MGLLIGIGQAKPNFPYDYFYGIEWDVTVSNPNVTRIGFDGLHKSLPLQSAMRRCVLRDNGTIAYYLHPNDSTKRDNGAAAKLDGSDGQVMVELPEMFVKFEMDGNKRRCLMSSQSLPGFIKWEKDYVSAYEATVQRSANKLSSVVNMDADYRGGNNTSAWDSESRTLLGRPATNISLTNFRNYARNRGSSKWNCNTYHIQRKLFWLFAVEYGSFYSQDDFNAQLDAAGRRQGGLGAGVTTLASGAWSSFNSYNPFVPCGHTNSLGNRSGVVDYVMPSEYGTLTVQVQSYRGVENPFGHVWKWTDGIKLMIQSDSDGGLSEIFVCNNPKQFSSAGLSGYDLRGNAPRSDGYVKEVILGEHGEIMPLSIGAGGTTHLTDYFYTSIPSSGISERGVLFGGDAYNGALAGFVCSNTSYTASAAYANVGSRLCFIPSAE